MPVRFAPLRGPHLAAIRSAQTTVIFPVLTRFIVPGSDFLVGYQEALIVFRFFLDPTISSAYRVACVLYDGVVLQQSQLGHRILVRKKSVVNKLLVAERTLSRKPPHDENQIRSALDRFESTGTQDA